MTPSPILKVPFTIQKHHVQSLLMGGQACVLYGAAEFSKDTDLAVVAEADNLQRLQLALDELQATPIAVPPFTIDVLQRGLAVHFRCQHPEAAGMRVDVMAVMRGVAPFDELWARRTTIELPDGLRIESLSLPDLVQAKKTQRDKDWPMVRRLVEANYAQHGREATLERVRFWFRECRTPSLLVELAQRFPEALRAASADRPLLAVAGQGDVDALGRALAEEEERERKADQDYWAPLRKMLEEMRLARRQSPDRHGGTPVE